MSENTLDLLVTTQTALLQVMLDLEAGKADVAVLHDICPVYFGVTPSAGGMLIAARNVDHDFRVVVPGLPCNAIWYLPYGSRTLEPYITHPAFYDLHQIHSVGNLLLVVIGRGSQLAVFDIATRQLVTSYNLESVLPSDLRRTDQPIDQYHFNSISSTPGRLFVLAHNWGEGSFALELLFDPQPGQLPVPSLRSIHRGLGHASHDIVFDDETLFVLDGEGGALIARGHPAGQAKLPDKETRPFPRGLIVMSDKLIVGYGSWSAEHGERAASSTRLCVYDRGSLDLRLDFDLGPFGNPSALSFGSPRSGPKSGGT